MKEALLSQCNMDRMLKEEAIHAVSEMDGTLNRINGIFLGSESTLKHAVLAIEKGKERSFSEQIAASTGTKVNQPKGYHTVAHPSDDPPSTFGLIVKAADSKTSSHETKRLIKETADPKALQLGVSKIKNLSNKALFAECKTETDRDT